MPGDWMDADDIHIWYLAGQGSRIMHGGRRNIISSHAMRGRRTYNEAIRIWVSRNQWYEEVEAMGRQLQRMGMGENRLEMREAHTLSFSHRHQTSRRTKLSILRTR